MCRRRLCASLFFLSLTLTAQRSRFVAARRATMAGSVGFVLGNSRSRACGSDGEPSRVGARSRTHIHPCSPADSYNAHTHACGARRHIMYICIYMCAGDYTLGNVALQYSAARQKQQQQLTPLHAASSCCCCAATLGCTPLLCPLAQLARLRAGLARQGVASSARLCAVLSLSLSLSRSRARALAQLSSAQLA